MAMKELKTFNVAPGNEEKTIQLWRSFGWELVGAPQEIKTEASQILTGRDSDGTEHYLNTAGSHYVKVTFERDPSRQNYAELKSFEEQYYAIKDPYCPYPPSFVTLLWIILIVIGLIALIFPGIILLIVHIISYIKKNKKWKEDYAKYQTEQAAVDAQREEILAKAQALV